MIPITGIFTKKETGKTTKEKTTSAFRFILNILLNLSIIWIDFLL